MPQPPNRKLPYELFGFNTGAEPSATIRYRIESQLCPFLNRTCIKFRKSTPHIKIGSCTVSYNTGRAKTRHRPVIICPHRFHTPEVFKSIQNEFYSDAHNVKWISEVKLGTSGYLDFVLMPVDEDGSVNDEFLCVEIQAAGTTGTPWNAIEFYRNHLTLENAPKVKYGINWANQYIKTMMQQLYKKGFVLDSWGTGRKLAVVLQDVAMQYIRRQGRGISRYNAHYPIQFRPFSMKLNECTDQWDLVPSGQRYSATISGLETALRSNAGKSISGEEEFVRLLHEKESDGQIY